MHFFIVIKEMAVDEATSNIFYNVFPKIIITEQGIDSYTTCLFHKYGFPNNTSQNSRGELHIVPHL